MFVSGNCFSQSAGEWQSDLKYLQQKVHSDYSNLFYKISAADWDKAVEEFNSQIPGMDNDQIITGFVKLIGLFQIGHTRVHVGSLQYDPDNLRLHTYPFQMYQFSDGVYILRADKKYEQAVGGKVLKIGNMETSEALDEITPLVNYENEFGLKSNIMYYMTIPEFLKTQGISDSKDEIVVSYLKNGKEENVVIKAEVPERIFSETGLVTPAGWTEARKPGDRPLWQKDGSSFRFMEYLPENKTLYVRHSVVNDDSNKTIKLFFENMEEFIDNNDVQKLILDVRMNGGGNNYLNKPVITSILRSEKINQNGKFYCIIGRRTFSAAQNLINELENYTEVIFVGEPTSENVNFYGDAKTEILPNSKIPVRLSWLWWQNKDPRDKRKATYPALAVDMSFADYYNNEDPVMKVINMNVSSESIDNVLKNLAVQGKLDEALILAKEYLLDPMHRYYKTELEDKVNSYGYSLMGDNKLEEANKILSMNVQLFPESANAYDSYAESFMKMGKMEEALKYYDIAIAKDKTGAIAENSKKMIVEINNQIKKVNH
jgi:tetratricopeptide (TPR) repeat protein